MCAGFTVLRNSTMRGNTRDANTYTFEIPELSSPLSEVRSQNLHVIYVAVTSP